MEINICGIPHTIKECPDKFNVDTHFGQIDHLACEIRVNAELNREVKKESTTTHLKVRGLQKP